MNQQIIFLLFLLSLASCTFNAPYLAKESLEGKDEGVELRDLSYDVDQHFSETYQHSLPNLNSQGQQIDFYKWAARKGHTRAYVILAHHYLSEESFDKEQALYWLELGVKADSPLCRLTLAQVFLEHPGTNKSLSYSKSQELLEPLLQDEYVPAFKIAARLAGLRDDLPAQIDYLDKARTLGDIEANQILETLVTENKSSSDLPLNESARYEEIDDLKGFWQPALESSKHMSGALEDDDTDPGYQKLLEIAHRQNSPYASLILARQLFDHGFQQISDSDKLRQYLESAMNIPAGKSLYARSIMTQKVRANNIDPLELLADAAHQEDPYALYVLSLKARIADKDYHLSTQLYERALKADNSVHSRFNVALDLLKEQLPFSDSKIAQQWMIDLASSNYPPALLQVASLKEREQILSHSTKEIFMHRIKAAIQGSPDGCYLVGNMYLTGNGVQPNPKRAFLWFMQAARSGYQPAQYQVSLMYHAGNGVVASTAKAYAWFSLLPPIFEQQQLTENTLRDELNERQLKEALDMSATLKKYYRSRRII